MQVNPCPECFEITISECASEIELIAGLSPETDYIVLLTDNFGKHSHEYTSDTDGNILINFNDYPQFTRFSGPVKLEVKAELNDVENVDLSICPEGYITGDYTCVLITFTNTIVSDVDFCEVIGCNTTQEPSIILSMSQECFNDNPFFIAHLIVVGGTGTYQLQRKIAGVWTEAETEGSHPTDGEFSLSPGTFGELTLTMYRVISGTLISNEVEFQLTLCE